MSVFNEIKNNVTARQAAEMYGLNVGRNGMACCPFHQDCTPSMKVDRRYYCFGCGATGDAIDLTAQLLGIGMKDAALRIADDFGLTFPKASNIASTRRPLPKARKNHQKEAVEWRVHALSIMLEYWWMLHDFEEFDAPTDMNDQWDDHPLFCLALQQEACIEFLLDKLIFCSMDQLQNMRKSCWKEVAKIEHRLKRLDSGRKAKTG